MVWIQARTEVDKVNRLVTLDQTKITKVKIPRRSRHNRDNGSWSSNSGNGWQSIDNPEPSCKIISNAQQRRPAYLELQLHEGLWRSARIKSRLDQRNLRLGELISQDRKLLRKKA